MGYNNWSSEAYTARQKHRRTTGKTAFTYDADVRASKVYKIHDKMNPFGVRFRESRDSSSHPDSRAIGVVFDVTGSMGKIPRVLQTKLGELMRTLIAKQYVLHPHIMFGALGDAYVDKVPLQVGQFESDLSMDDDLGRIFIEGGGGGQVYESYELALYFMARHTSLDCWEKRGQKGYLFMIGDELPYAKVSRQQVAKIIGDSLESKIPVTSIVEEVKRQYEFFFIIPTDAAHGKDPHIQEEWKKLVGERMILLENADAVCETIALTIGLTEGLVADLETGAIDLREAGYSAATVDAASRALVPYAASDTRAMQVVSASNLPAAAPSTADDGRLS